MVGVFLGLFFFLLTVDLWILQMILFYEVESDPSYAGKFQVSEEAVKESDQIVFVPVLITAILFGIYYFWYLITFANHMRLVQATST